MIEVVRASLAAGHDAQVVDELLDAYQEAKSEFYQGGHRLQAVEGGRFCEAAFRLLEQETTGTFTPIGTTLNTERLIRELAQLASASYPASVRLHIPRTLRVVYDIRNKRDAAHLADGIDPNLQDATLIVGNLDWVMAEFVRLWHSVTADEAQRIVTDLVSRRAPVIQDFDGHLKVLNPKLSHGEHVLVLLYHRGTAGASLDHLRQWSKPGMRNRVLDRLQHDLNYIHRNESHAWITNRGIVYVEQSGILRPE